MAWRKSSAMDLRVDFMMEYLRGDESMTTLCERYEISRKTGYKWLDRYRVEGVAGLAERSHDPIQYGRVTAPALVAAIEDLRRERPN